MICAERQLNEAFVFAFSPEIYCHIPKGVHFFLRKTLFIYFWLPWVFVAVCGLSLVVEHGLSSVHLSVVVAHWLSFPSACGIFPDQGCPCPLHLQVDSHPLSHQASPGVHG